MTSAKGGLPKVDTLTFVDGLIGSVAVLEMDLKSLGELSPCGFESRPGYWL